jgi:ketosteroid isomerase-like protein
MMITPAPTATPATQPRKNGQPENGALAVMEQFYAAEAAYVAAGGAGKASFDGLAGCLDPDVVLYQAPGLPFSGTGAWRGHDGIQRFLAVFSQTWQSMELLEAKPLVQGDTVVMLLRVRLCARATGRELDTLIVQVNTVRNGRVTEFRPFYWDPAAVADVCAYQQPGATSRPS